MCTSQHASHTGSAHQTCINIKILPDETFSRLHSDELISENRRATACLDACHDTLQPTAVQWFSERRLRKETVFHEAADVDTARSATCDVRQNKGARLDSSPGEAIMETVSCAWCFLRGHSNSSCQINKSRYPVSRETRWLRNWLQL